MVNVRSKMGQNSDSSLKFTVETSFFQLFAEKNIFLKYIFKGFLKSNKNTFLFPNTSGITRHLILFILILKT